MIDVDIERRVGDFELSIAFRAEAPVVGLFGRSGSGKTTVVNAIAGILRPRRGRIVINGVTLFDSVRGIDVAPERRRLGYVFQDDLLFPHLDVEANLLYGYRRASDAALSCDPQSPLVHKYRGHVLRSIAEPAGAAASYAAGLELTPIEDVGERACFLSLIGVCAMMSGDLETAEARLVDACAAGPELPHLLVNAGVIREARGDLVGALDLFDRAAEMHPPFLFEAPLERLEETAFTSLEYDAVPHFMGLQRHIDHCRAQLQREAPNA